MCVSSATPSLSSSLVTIWDFGFGCVLQEGEKKN